tara:strand:+ start:3565 stop:4809 length:1245 start_codon:yes stop_codon:yes gene_type:complete
MHKDYKELFTKVRSETEEICSPLEVEDYVVQPMSDVSPPKWHLGHTTWFFEQFILVPFLGNYTLFHPEFNYVFNSYYESVGARVLRTDRGNLSRPTTQQVYEYRAHVNLHMQQLLGRSELITEEVQFILEMGLNHEQQHQELLVYDIKYILGNNPLFPAYKNEKKEATQTKAAPLLFKTIDEGIYSIGYDGDGFHFDNEKGVHQVYINPFEISNRLITNAEYLEFINDGGYSSFQYWLAEGWDWVKEQKVKAPEYWHLVDGEWMYYTFNGLLPINGGEPVAHISFFEADAFARWKGCRLPTEFEWEVAANKLGTLDDRNFSEGADFRLNIQEAASSHYFGNLWEWTGSAYRPYPNYKVPEGALGEYNGKFMINQQVLRGGSIATPINHFRTTYRNFFHPQLRWMLSGFRLAKSL